MKRAFTLVEVLCVLAILAVLATLLFPVIAMAKQSAKVTSSASNLKQIHAATLLYQTNWDGTGNYGSTSAMGLPPSPAYEKIDALERLKPPNAPSPASPFIGKLYWVYYHEPIPDHPDGWAEYASRYKGGSLMYADPFNNSADVPLDVGQFVPRFVLGITVEGALLKKKAPGDWMQFDWWHVGSSPEGL